ncbi:glutamate racemase [Pedobacter yulinensis]|uniref:Glutamate racemase n=1 Tax=Pedobacter yulinensis TaxID=2126353 RepID=A0A2T3HII0_9SPHI|nr:glutamate racemase [Pedobacter yulinensis]PST82255.1 glutamate racemase [Pedobacter yulinensis]
MKGPIGIFDSGYGGLTVFKSIAARLPGYSYLYFGDNGRAPYGDRSFETVYLYTWECVQWMFAQGCPLVILACNTASAKALRSIQQNELQTYYPENRVLGVIRPTAETIGNFTQTGSVGVLGTRGTVRSASYPIEIAKFFPDVAVSQQSCPLWVPLIENNEHESAGADYFVKKYLDELLDGRPEIDTLLLACTHYPLLIPKIDQYLPAGIRLVSQGAIVASSLEDYLLRHPEIASRIDCSMQQQFFTTGDAPSFEEHASAFFGQAIHAIAVNGFKK